MNYTSEVFKSTELGIYRVTLRLRYIRSGCRFYFLLVMFNMELIKWDIPIATLLHKLGVNRKELARALDREEFLARQETIAGVEEK